MTLSKKGFDKNVTLWTKISLLPLFICFLLLSGCTATFLDNSPFESDPVNLTESSYAATDMLVQQSKSVVMAETPLRVGVLMDMNNPDRLTSFGRVVASQIGARFVQLGYNVRASSFDEVMMMRDDAANAAGKAQDSAIPSYGGDQGAAGTALLMGQYALARKEVLINLRIIEIDTGRVMAAYDYALPLNSDIKALVKTDEDKETLFGL